MFSNPILPCNSPTRKPRNATFYQEKMLSSRESNSSTIIMAEKSCPPNHSSPPRGSKIALLPLQLSHVKPD
jgi:hypothetical protein